jgi:hypothetical protein
MRWIPVGGTAATARKNGRFMGVEEGRKGCGTGLKSETAFGMIRVGCRHLVKNLFLFGAISFHPESLHQPGLIG